MKKIILDNGLRIVMEKRPFLKTVAISMVVKAGSVNETQRINGVAHFVEHMIFRWVRQKSQSGLMNDLESLGGNFYAVTQQCYTKYTINVLRQFTNIGLNNMCDILEKIVFEEKDVEKEKGVILEEIQQSYDQPFVMREEIFLKNLFKGHPLGLPILGVEQSIKNIKKEDLSSFYKKYYVPNNTVISIVGNINYNTVEQEIRKLFNKLKPVKIDLELPEIKARKGKIAVELPKKGLKQAHIVVGYYAPNFCDKKKYTMKLITTILGYKSSSRFYSKFIYDLGIAYSTGSETNESAGFYTNHVATSNKNLSLAKKALLKELGTLIEKGVTQEEIQSAKNYLKAYNAFCQELNYTLADQYALNESFAKAEDVNNYDLFIDSVDINEINRVVKEFFSMKNYVLIVLKPDE